MERTLYRTHRYNTIVILSVIGGLNIIFYILSSTKRLKAQPSLITQQTTDYQSITTKQLA